MTPHLPETRVEPSPYTRLYIPRRRMQFLRDLLIAEAEGYAPSNPRSVLLRDVEKALERNNPGGRAA